MESCVKYQAAVTIARDLVSMALGSYIVINEELSGHVHSELLYLAAMFIAGPTVIAATMLLRKQERPRGKRGVQPTPELSSSSDSSD